MNLESLHLIEHHHIVMTPSNIIEISLRKIAPPRLQAIVIGILRGNSYKEHHHIFASRGEFVLEFLKENKEL
jgi:hypothetical protein